MSEDEQKQEGADASAQDASGAPVQDAPAQEGGGQEQKGDGQEEQKGDGKADDQPQEKQLQVNYSVSGGLRNRLEQLGASIVFTSYQSGLLYLIGRRPEGGISIHHTRVPKPMGICPDENIGGFMVAGDYQISRFV
ncbi:MAG: DUF4915 domain-containing protein, partial [Hyphomicrobiales bacterium]|nr:DUF4915 domain-containing protein [Hyphomicrobiales bacterium]